MATNVSGRDKALREVMDLIDKQTCPCGAFGAFRTQCARPIHCASHSQRPDQIHARLQRFHAKRSAKPKRGHGMTYESAIVITLLTYVILMLIAWLGGGR